MKASVGYDMNPDEDTSDQIDASPTPVGYSRSKKSRSFCNYNTVIILLLVVINFTLAFQFISLSQSVTEALATNKAAEDKANLSLEKAINATQSQIEKTKFASDASSGNQRAQLDQISREVSDIKRIASTPVQGQVSAAASCPDMDFLTVATKHGTDKVVGAHVYNRLYEPYFHPVRCDKIKIMEIGLGCDMYYGPGRSYNLWLEYFPNAEIYFIEYDKKCADIWAVKNPRVKVYQGDQADREFLRNFIKETGGNFDFIIDDGGHSMPQQITSLEELVPALRPGGVYFLEDLLSSFWQGRKDNDPTATLTYIKNMMSDLMARRANLQPNLKPLTHSITRIDCIDEMCAFTKNK